MSTCPRCHQAIDAQAVICPHCQTPLKAFGHPGIPLHRATKDNYLCDSCTYHQDDTCTFPQRPYAKTCTLYQDASLPLEELNPSQNGISAITTWCRRNKGLLFLLGLLAISLMLAL